MCKKVYFFLAQVKILYMLNDEFEIRVTDEGDKLEI
jgi:hypothetical protein